MKATIERGVEVLVRHRRVAVIASLVVVAVLGVFAARLSVDNSLEVWFVEDDPTLVAYRNFLERFGNDEVVVTGIRGAADAFAHDRLDRLWHLTREIEAIEGVARVRSLANLESVQGSMIGPAVVPVVAPPVMKDDVERARYLVERDGLASDLVGQDGETLVLYTWLDVTPTIDTERGRVIDEIRAATRDVAGERGASQSCRSRRHARGTERGHAQRRCPLHRALVRHRGARSLPGDAEDRLDPAGSRRRHARGSRAVRRDDPRGDGRST